VTTARSKTDQFGHTLYPEADRLIVDEVTRIAAERAVPPAQVALAWVLRHPTVAAPIIGATKLGHLDDAIAALDITLTDDEVTQLEKPYAPHPVAGFQ
jgi:aryl-alcohol dehydrogenase (NADP+)